MQTIKMFTLYSAVCVILFLIKTRFPQGKPVLHYVRSKYGQEAVDRFRSIEKNTYRTNKINKDLQFLDTCNNYDVIPNFIKFRVHFREFQFTTTYRNWCRDLLDIEIKRQRKRLPHITSKLNDDVTWFKATLSSFDFTCLMGIINKNVDNRITTITSTHKRKLHALGIHTDKKVDVNKVIFNLSSLILTDEQKNVLAHGLDYCLPPTSVKQHQFFQSFEKILHSLSKCAIYKESWQSVCNSVSQLTLLLLNFRLLSNETRMLQTTSLLLYSPFETMTRLRSQNLTKGGG